jgi:hypothetical protein
VKKSTNRKKRTRAIHCAKEKENPTLDLSADMPQPKERVTDHVKRTSNQNETGRTKPEATSEPNGL